jgi:glutaredoxin
MKTTLATSPTCGPCFVLKNKLKEMNLSVETKDYSDSSNLLWFRELGIRSVPTLIVEDEGVVVQKINSVEEILKFLTKNQ